MQNTKRHSKNTEYTPRTRNKKKLSQNVKYKKSLQENWIQKDTHRMQNTKWNSKNHEYKTSLSECRIQKVTPKCRIQKKQ